MSHRKKVRVRRNGDNKTWVRWVFDKDKGWVWDGLFLDKRSAETNDTRRLAS